MSRRSQLGWAALGTGILALGFSPAARVPIVGDDFQALQEGFGIADGSFFGSVDYGWNAGTKAGHFNPVGQLLGGLYHFATYGISASLRIDPHLVHTIGSFAVIWLTVLAAAFAVVRGIRFADPQSVLPFWRIFALIGAVAGITLQLHPWSNDPVTTYTMAGFASAALGFLLLGFAFSAVSSTTPAWRGYLALAVTSSFAVVFYEMLVAAVAAIAVVFAFVLIRRRERERLGLSRILLNIGLGVVLPAIIFIGGRMLSASPESSGYTGTSFSLGLDGMRTWVYGMASSIPAGAWPITLYRIDPITMPRPAFVIAALLVIAIVVFAVAWGRGSETRVARTRRLWVPAAAIVTFWALSTAAHTFTPKYISEITAPGLVYLFYAVGVVAVAALIAGIVLLVPANRLLAVGLVAVPLVTAFAVAQVNINWTVGNVMRAAYSANSALAEASTTTDESATERCAILENWLEQPWPEYYRIAVTENLAENYERVFGMEFCSTPAR